MELESKIKERIAFLQCKSDSDDGLDECEENELSILQGLLSD